MQDQDYITVSRGFNDRYRSVEFPKKSDFKITYFYQEGNCVAVQRPGDEPPARSDYKTQETCIDQGAYNAARYKAGIQRAGIELEFKNYLFREFGVESNPKREQLYQIAYDHGHSSGFEEVASWVAELVELIRD